MLALRPNCECCNRDLSPESKDAMICTYECTFCADCVNGILQNVCPNCGGELVRRPVRPSEKRIASPASTERIHKPLAGERLEKHAAYVKRYSGIDPARR
ncbi:MAG: putative urease-associated protein [Herminiimonas sp.]|nr:putative urease-associated protein [Herminiimonas sp.]